MSRVVARGGSGSAVRSTTGSGADPATNAEGTRRRKRGEILAEQIENEIIESGWPVGEVIGSEAELTEKYGVSRAVFREAMRIVDHHGVGEMRRGPGGGLVVVAPSPAAAVRTVSLNLEYLDILPEQINEARAAIELACVRAAIERLDEEGEARIRDFLQSEVDLILGGRDSGRPSDDHATNDFHLLVADLTKNPAMRLFVQILSRLTSRHSDRALSLSDSASEVHRAHSRIARAILDRDVEAAERRMKRHLDSIVEYLH
jgi:DNA-binding FadR family transcriptional regulator